MVQLGPSSAPVIAATYRHLMPEDTAIWRKFIRNGRYLPDEVWYDIRVGMGINLPAGRPEWMERFAEYNYKKRIDIVGRKGGTWWVIECKPAAGVVALGQIIYYTEAFRREHAGQGRVLPVIITDITDRDLLPIFQELGVLVFEVGTDAETQGTL